VTQYFHLDESGDPGLDHLSSSTTHFVLAMVQLPERAPLKVLSDFRQVLHLSPSFEIKYHRTTAYQKRLFFDAIEKLPFRVRAIAWDKTATPEEFRRVSGQDITIEMICKLVLNASPLDICDDILIIDGATANFCRLLRVTLSHYCTDRPRPFKRIVGADSAREDGLQVADMVAGALRQQITGLTQPYYATFASKIVDLVRV
jgi:hypothetical protein